MMPDEAETTQNDAEILEKLTYDIQVFQPGQDLPDGSWEFIANSTANSAASQVFQLVERKTAMHAVSASLCHKKRELTIALAIDPDYPDTYLGHAIAHLPSLIYVYTKVSFRGEGIGTSLTKALLGNAATIYTPVSSPVGRKFAAHRGVTLVELAFWNLHTISGGA
jgi:hypothetical protein